MTKFRCFGGLVPPQLRETTTMTSSSLSLYREAAIPTDDEERDVEGNNSGFDLARFYASPTDGRGIRYAITGFAIANSVMLYAVVGQP